MKRPSLPIDAKLGAVAGIGILSTAAVGAVATLGAQAIDDKQATLGAIRDARANVLRLDTRASELKVDAYKAMLSEDPSAQKADVADDVAKATDLLGKLPPTSVLPADTARAVAKLQEAFTAYFTQIDGLVDSAVADQDKARAAYTEVQTANDATDDAIGVVVETMDGDVVDAEAGLAGAVASVKRTTIISLALAILLLAGFA